MLVLQETQPIRQVTPPSLLQSQHAAAALSAASPLAMTQRPSVVSLAGANVFNVSLGWKRSRANGLQQVCVRGNPGDRVAGENLTRFFLVLHNDDNLFPLALSQLVDILSMGFQNKFYNASKKEPAGSAAEGVSEYRINVSSDTPHWYIRDYMARVSSHYDIGAIEVDGTVSGSYL